VSRLGLFPIQSNFAENGNSAASPGTAAQGAHQGGDPSRGRARVHGGLQGSRGAGGFGGDLGPWGRAREGGREVRGSPAKVESVPRVQRWEPTRELRGSARRKKKKLGAAAVSLQGRYRVGIG